MKAIKCRFIVSSQTKLYIMRHGRFSLERERERERDRERNVGILVDS